MNPEIEKLMEAEQHNESAEKVIKKETDISDEQMVKHWKSYRKMIKTDHKRERSIGEHNNSGFQSSPKRGKFLKPEN